MSQRVMRIADIATTKDRKGMLPVSPAAIWRWVRESKFPKSFKLGESFTVWDAAEVETFMAQRAEGVDQ